MAGHLVRSLLRLLLVHHVTPRHLVESCGPVLLRRQEHTRLQNYKTLGISYGMSPAALGNGCAPVAH